jgi:hypothetical protein
MHHTPTLKAVHMALSTRAIGEDPTACEADDESEPSLGGTHRFTFERHNIVLVFLINYFSGKKMGLARKINLCLKV